MKSIKRGRMGVLFAENKGVSNRSHCTLFSIFLGFILVCSVAFPLNVLAAAPNAPTNLTATAASSRQINLTWQDNATNEANYYVERAPASTGTWTVIATLGANVTSYQNTGLTQNKTYYYRVRCKAGSAYSSYSNKANAKTATLAAPTALYATVASASQINLSWTDNTTYEINYYVYRSPNGSSSWTVIATLGTNVTTYSDTSRSVGTTYYYRVRAYDGTNYSTYSSVVNQTIRTIAASAGANGAISPSGTVAVANGSNQVFTMTPNAGYKIAGVTVDGSAVAINPTYTFSNITANHTISATFVTISVTGIIPPEGGTITLEGYATVTFPAGAFTSSQDVTISATSSPETENDYIQHTSGGPRLPYEIRINFGPIEPAATIDVVLNVPDTFLNTLPQNAEIAVFADMTYSTENELLGGFEGISSTYDSSTKLVSMTLPDEAFTNLFTVDGTYEAVVIIGTILN